MKQPLSALLEHPTIEPDFDNDPMVLDEICYTDGVVGLSGDSVELDLLGALEPWQRLGDVLGRLGHDLGDE